MISRAALAGEELPLVARHQPLDRLTRSQIALAAQFLRSIRPDDGEVEIMLHEVARRLEHVLEPGERGRWTPPAALAPAQGGTRNTDAAGLA
jgi:hypothetical protein